MKPKQKNIQKDILFILISSFVVVVAWIGFNLYHIWATSTVSETIQMQLTPIDPVFDPAVIQQVKTREQIEPLFEKQTQPTVASASPTEAPPPQTNMPQGAQLSPTQTITRQGQ